MGRKAEQHFYGFPPGEAEHRRRKVRKRYGAPAIHELHDVVALPGLKGLYSTDGLRIDLAAPTTLSPEGPLHLRQKLHSHTPEVVGLPTNFKVVQEPVLFGGFLDTHYGHFLIDGMSRLWAREMLSSLPILVTRQGELTTFRKQILDVLGVTPRLLYVDEPTIFRTVTCPGTSFEYRWQVYSVADEPHVQAARAMSPSGTWRRPVYLTRSGLPDQTAAAGGLKTVRKSNTEPELEAELSRRGFEVVRPESLPLADQIAMFEQAPAVVGTISSAFHTALFSRTQGATLAMFNWGRGLENLLLTDALKSHRVYYLRSIERHGTNGEFHLDVALSLRLLRKAGLI